MNLSTVKWAQWDKTHSRELLGPFICDCVCIIVAHNIAQNRSDNFPSYPPDNHHCSDDVYSSMYVTSIFTRCNTAIWHTHVVWEWYQVDWVKVLRPTRHRIGHFRNVLPNQSNLNLTNKQLLGLFISTVALCTIVAHNTAQNRPDMIDWVVVLRPTQHKIGHFGDVPQANLLAWYGKTKPNTTKAHIHQSKEMHYNT